MHKQIWSRIGLALVVAGLAAWAVPSLAQPTTRETGDIWFEDLGDRARLSVEDAASVLRSVAHTLATSAATPEGARLKGFPNALEADTAPSIVFLSVSDGKARARVILGSGLGLGAALRRAVSQLRQLAPELRKDLWIKLDVVERVEPPRTLEDDASIPFERSLQGIAFPRSSRLAFLAEELVSYTLVNSDAQLRRSNVRRYLERTNPRPRLEPVPSAEHLSVLRRFTTSSYFLMGDEVLSLYRGHRQPPAVSAEVLLDSARQAGHYLERSVMASGQFVYSFLPKTNRSRDDYNMVRHAGTVYAMLDLWETTRDPALLAAAERALGHLTEHVVEFGIADHRASVLAYGGKIKLGGVALAALALVEHVEVTKQRTYLPVAQRLCRYIQQSQLPTGEFIHQRYHPSGRIREFNSQYYPGEALLALVRIHSVDREESWLEVAERGARYLIEVRDRGIPTPDLTHDHWLLYALNELYRQRPEPLYLTHALRIAQAITLKQNRDPEFPDYLGSYYDPPRSTPTATRTEGLLAAYELARDFDRPADAESIMEAVWLNVGFGLQTQMTPERALYVEDPQRSLGGFTRSLTNFEIRIDYVQHNISALVALYRILGAGATDDAVPGRGASHHLR